MLPQNQNNQPPPVPVVPPPPDYAAMLSSGMTSLTAARTAMQTAMGNMEQSDATIRDLQAQLAAAESNAATKGSELDTAVTDLVQSIDGLAEVLGAWRNQLTQL